MDSKDSRYRTCATKLCCFCSYNKRNNYGNNFKEIILLALTLLVIVGCNMAMDKLDVVNGTKYVVKAKKVDRNDYGYIYNFVKAGDSWYDYYYKDTANFNVGDTIVITVRRLN